MPSELCDSIRRRASIRQLLFILGGPHDDPYDLDDADLELLEEKIQELIATEAHNTPPPLTDKELRDKETVEVAVNREREKIYEQFWRDREGH